MDPALQRDGAARRERRARRRDRDAARRAAVCTGAHAPRLTPTTHPATLARHALPCVAVWPVVTTRIHHYHAPPLLASGADGAAAAAEQAGHHLLRLCALQVGCIGPGTQPPASGVGRSCGRPCLGRLRLALCSRWRPSTPSFAPLLLQSADHVDWYLSAPCGSPSCASRGCRVLGDVSRSVGPVSVPTRLATGVLMRVHLCVFVPCTSSRLVSSVIVFSGNWRCAPALPQLAASEPAGVPSRRGSACCAACGGGYGS